jgi:hypothetical protein
MRHRIKSGKVGSYNPEKIEIPEELQEEQALSSEVEEIFEEDTAFSDNDEALAAMEFYDSPDDAE